MKKQRPNSLENITWTELAKHNKVNKGLLKRKLYRALAETFKVILYYYEHQITAHIRDIMLKFYVCFTKEVNQT